MVSHNALGVPDALITDGIAKCMNDPTFVDGTGVETPVFVFSMTPGDVLESVHTTVYGLATRNTKGALRESVGLIHQAVDTALRALVTHRDSYIILLMRSDSSHITVNTYKRSKCAKRVNE